MGNRMLVTAVCGAPVAARIAYVPPPDMPRLFVAERWVQLWSEATSSKSELYCLMYQGRAQRPTSLMVRRSVEGRAVIIMASLTFLRFGGFWRLVSESTWKTWKPLGERHG